MAAGLVERVKRAGHTGSWTRAWDAFDMPCAKPKGKEKEAEKVGGVAEFSSVEMMRMPTRKGAPPATSGVTQTSRSS